MVVPYANRASVATLPALALASKPATVKEVISDFASQCPHESVFESVQLIKGRTVRVVFASVDVMEDMVHDGLTFRTHPIQFKMPSVYKWVTLLDLPYGIPEGAIKTVLSKFGQIAHVRSESYMGLYTGTRQIKMEVKTPIPSRVVVAGHPCTIFYRGQVRSCFRCSQTGHEAKNCPSKQSAPPEDRGQREEEQFPSPRDDETPHRGEGMTTDTPTTPKSFAEVVTSPGTKNGTSGDAVPLTTTLEEMNITPPASPPAFELPTITDSEWTDSEGSDKPQTRLEMSTDDSTHDRSPLNKPTITPETETPISIVPTNTSPDIISSGNDASVHTEETLVIPDGQHSRQQTVIPSDIPSFNSGAVWIDWVVDVSPEILDAQTKQQQTEDLPSMDTSTTVPDIGESSAKPKSLKTRRRAHYPIHQKGKLASCIRQRTAPTLPGKRKAKCQPPPDSPYTPLVTDSGYLVTNTPKGISPDRPTRPDTGAAGAVSPSPSAVSHP